MVAPQAAARKEPMKERRPRVDGAGLVRRSFDFDKLSFAPIPSNRRRCGRREPGRGAAGPASRRLLHPCCKASRSLKTRRPVVPSFLKDYRPS